MLAVVRAAVAAELRYGSRDFLAASDLARSLPYAPPASALIGNAVRRPPLIRAFAAVALFGPFAVLVNLLSHPGRHPVSSWARYQLHTCLALDLGRAGSGTCWPAPPCGKQRATSTSSTCSATGPATFTSR